MVLGLLKRLLGGPEPQSAEVAPFGKILLFKSPKGSYWEAELKSADGSIISLAIETTDDALPSASQIAFFHSIMNDADAAFEKTRSLMVKEYEKWMRRSFPVNWREAFKLTGFSIPLDGNENNPWDIGFECIPDKNRHLFTCYFENGKPTQISIDG